MHSPVAERGGILRRSVYANASTKPAMKPNPCCLETRTPLAGVVCSAVLAAFLASAVLADDNLWTGTVDTNWNDTGNWSLGRVPVNPNPDSSFDDAIVNLATGNYPYVTAGNSASPRDIIIGTGAGASGRVDHVSGNLVYGANGGWLYIGRNGGSAVFNLADVATTGGGVSGFGQGTGSLTGGGNIWVGGTDFEAGGTGTLNVNTTGTIAAGGNLVVGSSNSATARGNGTMNIEAGTVTVNGEIWVGDWYSNGILNVGGTASITNTSWIAIGRRSGIGVLNMTGGSITKTGGGNVTISTGTGGTGTINQSGGVFTNTTSQTWLGESWNGNGNGTWNLSGTGQAVLGEVVMGNGGACQGTFNLNGGTLTATLIRENTDGTTTFNFNGGTLKAGTSQASFVTGLSAANVKTGGAIIDTNGYNIGIGQALLADAASPGGGLTKLGTGTLALTGANTYTGPNVVNAGRLVLPTRPGTTSGSVTVADGAILKVIQKVGTASLKVPAATFGSGGATTLELDLGNASGNPTVAPFQVTGTLTLNGPVTVNVIDARPALGKVRLVSYVAPKAGAGSFVLGALPDGVTATMTDEVVGTAGSVYLTVTEVSLRSWFGSASGTPNGTWDIATTTNWIDKLTNTAAAYVDGAAVVFPDLFDPSLYETDVLLDVTVAPGKVTFDNSSDVYTLSGGGKISGTASLVKRGTAPLTVYTLNDYTGATTLEGGTTTINTLADGGSPSTIGASSADPGNLVLRGGLLDYQGPAVSIDRGLTIDATGSGIHAANDLTLGGPVVTSGGNLTKTGAGNLTLTNPGANAMGMVNQGLRVDGGTLTLEGSGTQTNSVGGELWLGSLPDTPANLVLNNTSLAAAGWLYMGRGNGSTSTFTTLAATGSAITTAGFSTGYDAGLADNDSDQDISLTDTAWTANGNTLLAESTNATTTLTLAGASVYHANGRFQAALGTGSVATVTLRDSASLVQSGLPSDWVSIGGNNSGIGTLNVQDNATVTISDIDFNVSDTGTSTGTVNISGSAVVTIGGTLFIAKNVGTTGTLNLDGGTLVAPQITELDGGGGWSTFVFNGGLLKAATGAAATFMSRLDTVNVMAAGAFLDTNGQTVAIDQDLIDGDAGGGGLTKSGSGTLYLNGACTYLGTTSVTAGTLGGTGSVASLLSVEAGATLAPGVAVGTFTAGDANIAGTYACEIDGAAADKLVVGGNLDISTATLAITRLSAPTAPVYVIATYTSCPLPFLTVTGLPDGYEVVYDYDDGTTNTNIALVGAAGRYAAWAATHAGGQTADLDFDNDGVPNGVEFFMGETGSTFTANPGVVDGKIAWPKSAGFTGTYAVETSPDLAVWTAATLGVVDNGTSVEYTLPTGAGRFFVRLAVTPE